MCSRGSESERGAPSRVLSVVPLCPMSLPATTCATSATAPQDPLLILKASPLSELPNHCDRSSWRLTPSLRYTDPRWLSTVRTEIPNWSAISRFRLRCTGIGEWSSSVPVGQFGGGSCGQGAGVVAAGLAEATDTTRAAATVGWPVNRVRYAVANHHCSSVGPAAARRPEESTNG